MHRKTAVKWQTSVTRPGGGLVWHFPHDPADFALCHPSKRQEADYILRDRKARLFDLSVDRGEANDRSTPYPEEAATLKSRFDGYLVAVNGYRTR